MTTRTLIMAVPWVPERTARAVALMRETGGEIVWDKTHTAWDTWLDVLAAAGQDPVLILEDDVRLTANWREQVEQEISAHPYSVIQFFSMRKKDRTQGSRWEPGRTFIMNQCHYLPEDAASSLRAFAEGWGGDHQGHDVMTADRLTATGQRYWLHCPSLVQHEPWGSEIQPRRPKNRQSGTFR